MLELFFDLVFVAFLGGIVHRMVHMLENNLHHFDSFEFAFVSFSLFTMVIFWENMNIYNSRFEEGENYRHRFFIFLIMFGFILITASLYIDFGLEKNQFANFESILTINIIGYSISFSSLFYLYFSAWLAQSDKYEREFLSRNFVGIFFAILFWALPMGISYSLIDKSNTIQLLITTPLWITGLILWMIFEWKSRSTRISANTVDASLSHIQERVSIIFIVFIGESIVQIVVSSPDILKDNIPIAIFNILAAFLILFGWWWIFNDMVNLPDIKNHPRTINLYNFSMGIMLFSFAIEAVGLSLIIKDDPFMHGKYMLLSGNIIWSIANAGANYSLKSYKIKEGIFFPKKAKYISYISPIFNMIFMWIGLASFITPHLFMYILLILTSLFVLLPISIRISQKRSLSEEIIAKTIIEYYEKEDEWIKKNVVKFLDHDHHAKYGYKLNHYSKYIKIEEKEPSKDQP